MLSVIVSLLMLSGVATPMGVPESYQTTLSPLKTTNRVEETPYVAYLTIDTVNCTGALVGVAWVITSAFCYVETWRTRSYVMAGSNRFVDPRDLWRSSVQFDPVAELRTHPQYKVGGFEHNVMLVRAATKFGVSSWVRPVEVTATTRWPRGRRASCLASGMGQTRPEEPTGRLTTARVDVRGVESCEPWADDAVRQYTLCTRDAASVFCYGDQGGPVVQDGLLVAIQTSAAFRRPSRTDCGDRVLYQIYTFVGYYRPWIYSVVPQQTWAGVRSTAAPRHQPPCALLHLQLHAGAFLLAGALSAR